MEMEFNEEVENVEPEEMGLASRLAKKAKLEPKQKGECQAYNLKIDKRRKTNELDFTCE